MSAKSEGKLSNLPALSLPADPVSRLRPDRGDQGDQGRGEHAPGGYQCPGKRQG